MCLGHTVVWAKHVEAKEERMAWTQRMRNLFAIALVRAAPEHRERLRGVCWIAESSPQERQRRKEFKAYDFPKLSATWQERFKRLEDFSRPETCERCWQIAWQEIWEGEIWSRFAPSPPPHLSLEESRAWVKAERQERIRPRYRHLLRERQVVALLAPAAEDGVKRG
jgi:hypothetical protein